MGTCAAAPVKVTTNKVLDQDMIAVETTGLPVNYITKMLNPIELNSAEIIALRLHFEVLKSNADSVAVSIVDSIANELPLAIEKFKAAKIRDDCQWHVKALGFNFLSGIERLLYRLERPAAYGVYVSQLAQRHQSIKEVSTDMMISSLDVMERVIVTKLKELLAKSVTPSETDEGGAHADIEFLNSIWSKFFQHLRQALVIK